MSFPPAAMNRAYGVLEWRAVDEAQRIVEGIASTNAVDDYGTILEPKGATFSLPLPLLWQHRSDEPVGQVLSAKVTKDRITVRCQIATIPEPGPMRDLVDKAYQAVKHGLVRGFSVGFKPVKTAGGTSATDPLRFVEWVLRELSLVTLPANTEATISAVRSADAPFVAATGDLPASRDFRTNTNPNPRRGTMTAQEQAQQREERRAAAVERQAALMAGASAESRDLNEAENTEYEALTAEIATIDRDLPRLRTLAEQAARTAVTVPGTPAAPGQRTTTPPATPTVTGVQSAAGKGIQFARQAMALARCGGNRYEAAEYARNVFGDEDVATHIRAAIAAGTTAGTTFAAPLVQTNYLDDFLELLRPKTIIGRIPGLRHVPFNVSMPSQTAGGTYGWVGEGKAKPLTNMAFASVSLGMAKAAGIIVLTEELVRSSSPSAQEAVRDEMLAGIPAFLDVQFVDPTVAAVANVSPASITNGVAGTAASGTAEANARADLRALLAGFATGNYSLSGVVLLMSESVAFTLGTMVNAVGEPAFPGVTPMGGNILGIPVVTSNAVGAQIIAVHAPSILIADEGGVEIDISREASLQMDSAPTEPTDASTVLVSLWQRNLVGLRGERFINWAKARSDAVRRIHTVAYA